MNQALSDANLVRTYAEPMQGVFATADLRRLFNLDNRVLLHRRIGRLTEAGILSRFCRGVYVSPGFSPEALAARVNAESYLSFGTVLAKELVIGSVPAATVYAVKTGPSRTYQGAGITLDYAGVVSELFFGYRIEDGIRYATPEKALLDTLYFHQSGRRFSFNIYEDVDRSRIDQRLAQEHLTRYRNPRFVAFAREYLREGH